MAPFFTVSMFLLILALAGCEASSVDTMPAKIGESASRTDILDAVGAGQVVLDKRIAARWEVPLSGLLNLEHPAAVAAGIEDRSESIEIYVYLLQHPTRGVYLIDSGVSQRFEISGGNPDLSTVVSSAMNMDLLEVQQTTTAIVDEFGGIDGVFLSHIHLDHIMGLADLSADTPVYSGPGEAGAVLLLNAFSRGTTDRLLAKQGKLLEWSFDGGKVLDVFGDGSVFAIHSPGHTPGSTAYLVMATDGPHLIVGDATHTRWGWNNGVEPGSFSADIAQSAQSLAWLKQLADEIPGIQLHPGHQSLQ